MRNGRELVSDCYGAAQTSAEPQAAPKLAAVRALPDLTSERSESAGPQAPEQSALRRSVPTRFGKVRRVLVDEQGAVTAEYAIVIIRRPLAPTEFRVTQDPRSPAVPLQHQRGSERRINTPHGR